MLCKTCKYFSSTDSSDASWGNCICPKFATGYNTNPTDLDKDQMLVEDDEGWSFIVGPEFGCIHHKEV
jgi:hypothetical protein